MTQSLSEQDLAMLRMALEGARSADAVVRFTYAVLADRYGLVDGDQINANTGRIARRNAPGSAAGTNVGSDA